MEIAMTRGRRLARGMGVTRWGVVLGAVLLARWQAPAALGVEAAKRSDVPMTRPEEALARIDGRGSAAGFTELADGSILMAYEVAGRRGPNFATSRDGGLTWSEPAAARDVDGAPLKGSGEFNVIRLAGNGVGYVGRTTDAAGLPYYLLFYRSEDGGRTWQRPIKISPPSPFGVATTNDVIFRTSSGRIILPAYGFMKQAFAGGTNLGFEQMSGRLSLGALRKGQWIGTGAHHTDPTFCWSFVYYSDDDGRGWKSSRGGEIFLWDGRTMSWSMAGEPTAVEVEPGKILMYMRTDWGRLFKSWSFDNGETWSAPTPTPLASSGAPAQLRKIPGTGDLLVVWTQVSDEEMRKGFIRARLSSAVSRTNGALWEFFQNVESILEGTRVEPGPVGFVRPEGMVYGPTDPAPERDGRYVVDLPDSYCRCSYPSAFFYRDRLLVGHTNAHYTDEDKYVMPGRLIVVPISWLYGGAKNMKPNPELRKRFPIGR